MFSNGYSKLPPFSELNISKIDLNQSILEFFIREASLVDLDKISINDFLSYMKKKDSSKVSEFINYSLDLYFTHPKVTSSIQNGRSVLFPHQRYLKDMDYDLLIPVFERGGENE